MNVRRRLRELAALLGTEKLALAHAEARYKSNRRNGFKAHNRQRHCEDLAKRNMHDGHRERAHREMERAHHFSEAAHLHHGRAQYWFAEVRHVSNRIHKLEFEQGKLEKHGDKTDVMFDSVTLSEIPRNAPAVAGYVGGLYRTYPSLAGDFPKAHRLSIAISAVEKARCLDIENGDATPYQFPGWLRREVDAAPTGAEKHIGYGSVSAWVEIRLLAEQHGLHRGGYLVWTAHYTGTPHICGPHTCGELPWDADLTQWTSGALGRNLDESKLSPGVFA